MEKAPNFHNLIGLNLSDYTSMVQQKCTSLWFLPCFICLFEMTGEAEPGLDMQIAELCSSIIRILQFRGNR